MGTDKQGKRIAEPEQPKGFWKITDHINVILAIGASIVTIYGASGSSGNTVSLEDSTNQGVIGQITNENGNGRSVNLVAGDGAQIFVQDSGTKESEENMVGLDELALAISSMTPDEKLAFSSDRIRNGEHAQAVYVLSELLGENITDPQLLAVVYYNRGLAHFYLGEYAQAQLDLEQAIASNEFPDAYYNLGVIHHNAFSEYDQAITAYSKALEFGDNVAYRLARAAAYEKTGEYQAAERDYLAVLDAEPQNEAALEGEARLQQAA